MISYKDNIQVTSATTGTGTLTQSAAVTGFAAPASGDDGKTFTVMVKLVDASGIPTGEWELCESVYTHSGTTWSRGTLIDSSTGSRVTFSAGTKHIAVVAPARVFGAAGGGLEISNQTVTTADITGAVGNMYVCTIAGLTNHRSLTLPSAAVGERIGVHVVDGDDTYALILKGAASQTINGGSAATEWSRVFIKGETVIFKCIAANTWIVESDGRIPCYCHMESTVTQTITANAATIVDTESIVVNVGNCADTTNKRIKIRRAATGSGCYVFVRLVTGLNSGDALSLNLYKNGATEGMYGISSSSFIGLATPATVAIGDYLQIRTFFVDAATPADNTTFTTAGNRPLLIYKEKL